MNWDRFRCQRYFLQLTRISIATVTICGGKKPELPFASMSIVAPHILVVDDDPLIRELLTEYLTENDFRVTTVGTGAEMTQSLQEEAIDLVMLDLRLTGEDGMQLARELRETNEVPVIIVTGKRDEADRVMGLEIAADDYVTKPFSNRELLARIRAVLRRYQARREVAAPARDGKRRAYRFAGWELNLLLRRLTAPDGHRVELSNGEFNLLLALCGAAAGAVARSVTRAF
jgi:two-component system OmpR family response regulator